MTPSEAHKPENEQAVRHTFITRYKLKRGDDVKFDVGDKVRIYKFKTTFDKKSGKKYTDEVFTVKEVKDSKPHVYELVDSKGEEILGTFYSWELVQSSNDVIKEDNKN